MIEEPKILRPNTPAEIIRACANGNAAAADFLSIIHEYAHTIDDVIDHDKGIVTDAQLGLVSIKLILTIGGNQFYQANRAGFEALIERSVAAWVESNSMGADNPLKHTLKSLYHEIFWHAARLTGGWEYMRKVCAEFRHVDPD